MKSNLPDLKETITDALLLVSKYPLVIYGGCSSPSPSLFCYFFLVVFFPAYSVLMILLTTETDFNLALTNNIFKSEAIVLCSNISPEKN